MKNTLLKLPPKPALYCVLEAQHADNVIVFIGRKSKALQPEVPLHENAWQHLQI